MGKETSDSGTIRRDIFSLKRCIHIGMSAAEAITTVANDNPYNNTSIELRFDWYHDKNIAVKIPIREILNI